MPTVEEALEKAKAELWMKPMTEFNGRAYQVVAILPNSPPLDADWWKGKQVHLRAVEVNGNFFLRHCDGSVRYWEHATQKEVVAFKSEREFAVSFKERTNNG